MASSAVNYTNKTQFIFRIAKGYMEEYDDRVNDSMPDVQLRIPYENIVYIGDSETDIPCMRLVKSRGGYSIGVFDPEKDNRSRVYQLYNDGRLSFYAPDDYSARSDLTKYIKQIIDEITSKERIKTEQKVLQRPAELYKMMVTLGQIESSLPDQMTTKEKREFKKMTSALDDLIPGNLK